MDTKALRQKILDLAIRGKLVPQDPNDEPASVLLERIREQKKQMVKDGRLKPKDIKNDTVIFKGDDNLHYEKFQDGTVKCIEDEIPFELPEGWEWCRLQTICTKEIKRGKAPKYEEKSDTLVFAQKCNTKAGFIDISKAKYLAQTSLKKYADEDFLFYNDIIINSTGTGTMGRIGIYMKEDDIYGIKIVPDSHITTVRTMSSELNARYVYYFLKYNQSYFENSGVGSTNQKELKPEVISTFLIAIPPIEEQNNIVAKVDITNKCSFELDNKKEQLKELISATKSKILDLAIRGKLVTQDPNDEPASALLERIRAEKEELIKQGKIKRNKRETVIFKGDDNSYYEKMGNDVTCIDEEIPFDIPPTWNWCRLGTIGEWASGATPSRKNPEYYTGSIPWLKTGDLNDDYITYIPECISEKALQQSSLRVNPAGSVLIAMYGATIGKLGILTFPATTNQACCACLPFNGIDNQYLFYYLMSQKSNFIYRGVGGAQSNISKEKIVSTLFPLPPEKEQKRILLALKQYFKLLNIFN